MPDAVVIAVGMMGMVGSRSGDQPFEHPGYRAQYPVAVKRLVPGDAAVRSQGNEGFYGGDQQGGFTEAEIGQSSGKIDLAEKDGINDVLS